MAIIDKPTDYFDTVIYSGNGGTQSITSLDFQPDFLWGKQRNVNQDHVLLDSIRGTTKQLYSSDSAAEQTNTTGVTSFNSDGFSLGSSGYFNNGSNTYVAWNWKAGGSASSNSNGSITSSVSANQDAGFSIVSYSGNSTAGATIGHGLGAIPKMMIVRKRNSAENWLVYHASTGNTGATLLNGTNAFFQDNMWNSTSPTSSVFTVHGDAGANASGGTYIAYCFAEKQGYSKFGSYVGSNSGAYGPFIYTGFKPAFVLIKDSSAANAWTIRDDKRNTFNPATNFLMPNASDAEVTAGEAVDILSNGFKIKANGGKVQDSGNTYIYMAFAENPFVASNFVPATAR